MSFLLSFNKRYRGCMTVRAVTLGLLGACCICGVTYFNDVVMDQTYFIGNYLPIGVYGGLVLFLLIVNPLLRRLYHRLALTGRELAVILTLTLAACCIPGPTLMRAFTATQILPHQYNRTEGGWQAQGVLDMAPKVMLADVTEENQGVVLSGFVKGMPAPKDRRHITLGQVPWSAWTKTLSFWLPLMFSFWFALIGLSIVLHRQWSSHEQLAYPIATFADSLLPSNDGKSGARGKVFASRLFWIGAGAVFLIHVNNFAASNFPDYLIPVPMVFDLLAIKELFPTFFGGFTYVLILRPAIFFTVIAIAYFLASDVSLSLGLGPVFYCAMYGYFGSYGVSLMSGGYLEPKGVTFLFFGAFVGMFLAVIYMGRHYYLRVLARAIFLPWRRIGEVEPAAVWGARVCMIGLFIFSAMLIAVGVDWQIAPVYTLLLALIFVVQSRILAETGAFFMRAYWWPCVVIAGLMGIEAIGPRVYLILMMVTTVFALDPREALMPYIVNSLKLLDKRRLPLGRSAVFCGVSLILGMTVALPVTLYFQYDRGMDREDTRAIVGAPKNPYIETVRVKQRLASQDKLEQAEAISGWQRFAHLNPKASCLIGFGFGLGLVVLFTFCRLRFTWWPLHPVLFLVWQNYPGGVMAPSFLIGWFIKVMVTRYGGAGGYQSLKPLMIGLIAGDVLGAVMPLIIGGIKFMITGEPPMKYNFMPA